jgi:hypothetical protein
MVSILSAILTTLKRFVLACFASDDDIVCFDLLFGRIPESDDNASLSNLDNRA